MKLVDRQRRFLDALFAEGGASGAASVYRENMLANLHGALAATYPVVQRLVAPAFFAEAARRYALAHPSKSGDLHRYGERFPDFLGTYAPACELPYLADVARLEWLCAEAFHAPDTRSFDFTALAAMRDAERARVRLALQPGFRSLWSEHPIVAIWEANQLERDGTPERARGPDRAVVYRDGFEVRVENVDVVSWRFLEAVANGETLEAIAQRDPISARLAEELVRWTRCGAIDAFGR